MGRLVFITGGARSGKSRFALSIAKSLGKKKAFIATAQVLDDEMRKRIMQHRKARARQWYTVEEPMDIKGALKELDGFEVVVVDCLTLWLNNLISLERGKSPVQEAEELAEFCKIATPSCVLVSNEVGLGIVPESPLGRSFRDLAGKINQIFASASDEVYIVISGIPLRLK